MYFNCLWCRGLFLDARKRQQHDDFARAARERASLLQLGAEEDAVGAAMASASGSAAANQTVASGQRGRAESAHLCTDHCVRLWESFSRRSRIANTLCRRIFFLLQCVLSSLLRAPACVLRRDRDPRSLHAAMGPRSTQNTASAPR